MKKLMIMGYTLTALLFLAFVTAKQEQTIIAYAIVVASTFSIILTLFEKMGFFYRFRRVFTFLLLILPTSALLASGNKISYEYYPSGEKKIEIIHVHPKMEFMDEDYFVLRFYRKNGSLYAIDTLGEYGGIEAISGMRKCHFKRKDFFYRTSHSEYDEDENKKYFHGRKKEIQWYKNGQVEYVYLYDDDNHLLKEYYEDGKTKSIHDYKKKSKILFFYDYDLEE